MSFDPTPASRPTRVRYLVLALTTLVAVLLYLDRICLSFAERYVKEDLGVTDGQMAVVLSSFFWAYAIGQLPAGWLSDRFGARVMLTIYLAVWSLFTGLLGLAATLAGLVIMRLGCGLFQAGAYPGAAGLISKWMPYERRGLASGIVSLGGRLGGAVAPVLTAYLMVAFVPVGHSSLLAPNDILNQKALIDHLTQPPKDDKDAGRKVFAPVVMERLPPALASELRGADAASIFATPEGTARLVAALNDVLRRADLLDGIDLKKFDLPKEAVLLAQSSDAARTPAEIERRNRLILEAAFPDAIRKIYGNGWRPVMVVYGVVGVILAGIFWMFLRDSPRRHPGVNAAELALIDGAGGAHAAAQPRKPFDFTSLLTSLSLWFNCAVQMLTNVAWIFLVTWFPRFLDERFRVPVEDRGWLTSIPIFVGMVGMFLGGWITDVAAKHLGKRWGRALPLALSRFLVAAGFMACIYLHSPWPVTLALAVVAFATDIGTPAIWAYHLDVGGKHVGAVLGWSNMYGNIGAAISPILLNAIVGDNDWDRMFIVCAAAMVLAGILSLFIDATKPVIHD